MARLLAFDRDFRGRTDRERGDGGWIIAFVGSAHELMLEAQGAHDFRGAGDEGYDPMGHGAMAERSPAVFEAEMSPKKGIEMK